MSSLIESLNAASPEIVRSLAARLGEPNTFVQKGLQISAAVMLGAIASRSKEPNFMSQVTNMIVAFGGSQSASSQVPKADTDAGSAFLAALFGNDRPLVEKRIAQATGLGNPSAPPVLASAAPLLLNVLASKLASSTLGQVVADDLPQFMSFVPAGVPGQSRLPGLAAGGSVGISEIKPGQHWLWQVLALGALLIIALVWYAYRGSAA
jgi:hypothetical protein